MKLKTPSHKLEEESLERDIRLADIGICFAFITTVCLVVFSLLVIILIG